MTGHPLDNAISDAASVDPVQKLVAEAAVQLASQQVVNDMSFRLDELESTVRDIVPAYGTDGGGGGGAGLPSVYDIATDDNGNKFFVNRYFEVSGVTMEGPQGESSWYSGSYVAIRLQSSDGSGSSIVAYDSLGALQAAQRDQDYVVIPLYKFDSDGNVECDLRHMPRADMWSLGLPSGTSS